MMWFIEEDGLGEFHNILNKYDDLKIATSNALDECNKLLKLL